LIDFPYEFTEKKDILSEIPLEEYDNLARKCLKLLERLLKDREFKNEGTIEDRMRRYEERSNPLAQFIKDRCIKDFDSQEPLFKFDDELNLYLKERGHRKLGRRETSRLLRNEGYDVEKKHVQIKEKDETYKDTKWMYVFGLRIKQPGNLNDYPDAKEKVYKEESGPVGPNGPHISVQNLIGNLSEIPGPMGPLGPGNIANGKQGYEIHLKCSSCGNEPSHTYNSHGKPICQDCANSMTTNQIPIENNVIIEEEVVEQN
jgi:hypothetical protein